MSQITEAADFIKRQAKLHEQFVVAAEALDRVGSLEQAEKEAQAALKKADAARVDAEAALLKIQGDIDAAKPIADQIKADAAAEAKAKADATVAKAEAKAAKIVAAAEDTAKTVEAASNEQLAQAQADLEALQAQRALVEADVSKAKEALAATQIEHDKLVKAIESMKAKFA